MPDYPITFVASFAVNGVMVLIVFLSLTFPTLSTHAIKINLSLFLSGVLALMIPLLVEVIDSQLAKFWLSILLMLLIGVTMGVALA